MGRWVLDDFLLFVCVPGAFDAYGIPVILVKKTDAIT